MAISTGDGHRQKGLEGEFVKSNISVGVNGTSLMRNNKV